MHGYILELFRFLGRGGIGAWTERSTAGGIHASHGTFSCIIRGRNLKFGLWMHLWMTKVAYHPWVMVTLTLTSDLVQQLQ